MDQSFHLGQLQDEDEFKMFFTFWLASPCFVDPPGDGRHLLPRGDPRPLQADACQSELFSSIETVHTSHLSVDCRSGSTTYAPTVTVSDQLNLNEQTSAGDDENLPNAVKRFPHSYFDRLKLSTLPLLLSCPQGGDGQSRPPDGLLGKIRCTL